MSILFAAITPEIFGIPVEFILFALTLLGVAFFHHKTLRVGLIGLIAITLFKLGFAPFQEGAGFAGLGHHLVHEWVVITNLFCLLTGFTLLARHFEKSEIPASLPRVLPDDWKGAFLLLVLVFALSAFLDNIAAALIGGTVAGVVFQKKVHIGYLAAIVAASNAGGAGSVVGDTTTTMMWIDGVDPSDVLHGFIASGVALLVFGIPLARAQQRYSPITKNEGAHAPIDWARVSIVGIILAAAIGVNVFANVKLGEYSSKFPFIGVAVWLALLGTSAWRKPDWAVLPEAAKGSIFLLSLVLCASMMPVEKLPPASWGSALSLGFISSIFDNIPLTALALKQGGYDWGMLAYAVGFGGSMIWFGSSAGVAVSNLFPEAKSVGNWLRSGYMIAVAYVVGFFVLLATLGWHPHEPHKPSRPPIGHQAGH